jgi:hypothetical protein
MLTTATFLENREVYKKIIPIAFREYIMSRGVGGVLEIAQDHIHCRLLYRRC